MTLAALPLQQQQPAPIHSSSPPYAYERRSSESFKSAEVKSLAGSTASLFNGTSSPAPTHSKIDTRPDSIRQSSAPATPCQATPSRHNPRDPPSPSGDSSPSPNQGGQHTKSASLDVVQSNALGASSAAPAALSPVSLLTLRSPATFLEGHASTVGGPSAGPNGGSATNFSWSPTTAMFFGHKSNGLPSSRFSTFKKEAFDTGSITPSLYTHQIANNGDSQNSYYPSVNRYNTSTNSSVDGTGAASNHHNDWAVQHTSWTGLPTPSTEAVLKSITAAHSNHNGNGNQISSSLNVDSSWDHLNSNSLAHQASSQRPIDAGTNNSGTTLFNGHMSPAIFRGGNCASGMLPPTPRSVLSGVTSSRAIPRSAGLSWLYQDMGMPNLLSHGNSNPSDQYPALIRQGHSNYQADHHLQQEQQQQQQQQQQQAQQQAGMGGMHPFNFSPQQPTLGRPPLSARAPRLRVSASVTMGHTDWQPGRSNCSNDGSNANSPDGSEGCGVTGPTGGYFSRADSNYASEEARWIAVQTRDSRASASFFYCVRSTKIFCRTTCPSRRPVRENICFVSSAAEANALGYRACKRCKPDVRGGDPHETRQEILIAKVKERLLQSVLEGGKGKAVKGKGLKYIAEDLGVSHWHLHRCFKKRVNQTPEAWAKAQAKKMRSTFHDNSVERDDSRDSVGAHSVASSSSILTNGLRADGSLSHHHRHQAHYGNDHYAAGPRITEMMAFGH